MSAYEFVEREKATHAVVTLCRLLGVSPSGYWAWRKRAPSLRVQADAHLTQRILAIHQASRGTYGVPRVHAELASAGTRCGRKRVARLMRQAGVIGCHRRRPFPTTRRDPAAEPAPDLVERTFSASAPNQLWIADITSVPTQRRVPLSCRHPGCVQPAGRGVVDGGSPARRTRRGGAGDGGLEPATSERRDSPFRPWLPSTPRCSFGERCQAVGIRCSMGSVGDSSENHSAG